MGVVVETRDMRKPILLMLALVVSLAVPGGVAEADGPQDLLIVANQGVPEDELTLEEVKAIFLKQRKSWKAGSAVVPIHAKTGSTLRRTFLERVLAMTEAEELSYWEGQKIRKGVEGPPEFGNPLKAVFRIKGGISYVLRSDYKEGVAKVLLVVPR